MSFVGKYPKAEAPQQFASIPAAAKLQVHSLRYGEPSGQFEISIFEEG
jgi:hypothetical protein